MADLDTALKRLSGFNVSCPWRGQLPFPDASVDDVDRPVGAYLYAFAAAAPATTAAITGTATASITEADIVVGGKTIIITLTNDTWVAAGAAFNAQRQNIIDGLTSGGAEALGWNNVVKALQGVAGVARTSNTVVTITLDAQATYDIASSETVTVTVPASALVTSLVAVVGTPTFSISAVAPPVTEVPAGGTSKRRKFKRIIRWSELNEQERMEALAGIKVRPAPKTPEPIPFEEDEDDDIILMALTRILH